MLLLFPLKFDLHPIFGYVNLTAFNTHFCEVFIENLSFGCNLGCKIVPKRFWDEDGFLKTADTRCFAVRDEPAHMNCAVR